MKKSVLIIVMQLAFIVFVAPPLWAEDITGGIKGGLSLANLRGEDVYNNSLKYGGTGGIFMRYTLTDIFAIQPEILFAMKGAKYEAEGIKSQQKINYLEVPVLVRMTLPNQSKVKPSLLVGPALGILLSNKITNGEEIDIKDDTKTSDLGVVAGVGIEYLLKKGCIILDARYEMGLTSIMKETGGEQKDVKNSVFLIMIGYGMQF